MAGKLSPTAQQQVILYESFSPHVARLNSLVEQFAAARTGQDQLKASLKRAASQVKLRLMSAGLDNLGQLCGSIELAAGRSGNPNQIARILRELIGSLKFQLDLEIRTIVRSDQEAAAKKQQVEEKQS
jgi:hypothetical protein